MDNFQYPTPRLFMSVERCIKIDEWSVNVLGACIMFSTLSSNPRDISIKSILLALGEALLSLLYQVYSSLFGFQIRHTSSNIYCSLIFLTTSAALQLLVKVSILSKALSITRLKSPISIFWGRASFNSCSIC